MKTKEEIEKRLAELIKERNVYRRMASKDLSLSAFLACLKECKLDKDVKLLEWVLS